MRLHIPLILLIRSVLSLIPPYSALQTQLDSINFEGSFLYSTEYSPNFQPQTYYQLNGTNLIPILEFKDGDVVDNFCQLSKTKLVFQSKGQLYTYDLLSKQINDVDGGSNKLVGSVTKLICDSKLSKVYIYGQFKLYSSNIVSGINLAQYTLKTNSLAPFPNNGLAGSITEVQLSTQANKLLVMGRNLTSGKSIVDKYSPGLYLSSQQFNVSLGNFGSNFTGDGGQGLVCSLDFFSLSENQAGFIRVEFLNVERLDGLLLDIENVENIRLVTLPDNQPVKYTYFDFNKNKQIICNGECKLEPGAQQLDLSFQTEFNDVKGIELQLIDPFVKNQKVSNLRLRSKNLLVDLTLDSNTKACNSNSSNVTVQRSNSFKVTKMENQNVLNLHSEAGELEVSVDVPFKSNYEVRLEFPVCWADGCKSRGSLQLEVLKDSNVLANLKVDQSDMNLNNVLVYKGELDGKVKVTVKVDKQPNKQIVLKAIKLVPIERIDNVNGIIQYDTTKLTNTDRLEDDSSLSVLQLDGLNKNFQVNGLSFVGNTSSKLVVGSINDQPKLIYLDKDGLPSSLIEPNQFEVKGRFDKVVGKYPNFVVLGNFTLTEKANGNQLDKCMVVMFNSDMSKYDILNVGGLSVAEIESSYFDNKVVSLKGKFKLNNLHKNVDLVRFDINDLLLILPQFLENSNLILIDDSDTALDEKDRVSTLVGNLNSKFETFNPYIYHNDPDFNKVQSRLVNKTFGNTKFNNVTVVRNKGTKSLNLGFLTVIKHGNKANQIEVESFISSKDVNSTTKLPLQGTLDKIITLNNTLVLIGSFIGTKYNKLLLLDPISLEIKTGIQSDAKDLQVEAKGLLNGLLVKTEFNKLKGFDGKCNQVCLLDFENFSWYSINSSDDLSLERIVKVDDKFIAFDKQFKSVTTTELSDGRYENTIQKQLDLQLDFLPSNVTQVDNNDLILLYNQENLAVFYPNFKLVNVFKGLGTISRIDQAFHLNSPVPSSNKAKSTESNLVLLGKFTISSTPASVIYYSSTDSQWYPHLNFQPNPSSFPALATLPSTFNSTTTSLKKDYLPLSGVVLIALWISVVITLLTVLAGMLTKIFLNKWPLTTIIDMKPLLEDDGLEARLRNVVERNRSYVF